MKTTIEDLGPWQKAISITLDPEEVEREMDRVVARYRQKAVMPGFRRGKVPTDIVRATYRESMESDLLNHMLPEATGRAVEEHGLELAAPPRVRDLNFRPGEPLSFTAVVDLWPRLDVGGIAELEVDEVVTEVDDEMVAEFLQAMRERMAEFSPVARASREGDVLDVTLQPVDLHGQRLSRAKRQDVKMEAGGEHLLPEFRAASLGVEPGETRMVHVHYPEDYEKTDLAGKERHFQMRVRQILEKKLPELDDAFAGRVDGLGSLEALKSKVALRLEAEERLRARRRTEETMVDALLARNPFEVPEGIVERSLARAMEKAREENKDLDEEEFRRVYTPVVVRLRKREILLDSIARQESVAVTDDELDEEIRASAPAGIDPRVIRRRLERDDELDRVRQEILERKIFELLSERSKVHRVVQPRQKKSNLILP